MIAATVDELRLYAEETLISEQFAGLAAVLATMRESGINVSKRSNVWEAKVSPGLLLYELLFESTVLDADICQLLLRELDGLPQWDTADDETRSSEEFTKDEIRRGRACACVVTLTHEGIEQFEGSALYLIGSKGHAIKFYREAAKLGNFSEREFMRSARIAFPNLYFHADLESQISSFSLKFRAGLREELTSALAALDDHLLALLDTTSDIREVPKKFAGLSAFEISPESPNTHRNRKAMLERDVTFENAKTLAKEKLRCEWHLKLRPTCDRIHFYFGKNATAPGKILVGKFCYHLTT